MERKIELIESSNLILLDIKNAYPRNISSYVHILLCTLYTLIDSDELLSCYEVMDIIIDCTYLHIIYIFFFLL